MQMITMTTQLPDSTWLWWVTAALTVVRTLFTYWLTCVVQESHAYDSFQYLMAKFNQKAAAAKEAKKEAAAAREAAAKKHSTAQQPSSHKSASGKAVGTSRHAPASTVDADSKLQEALRVSAPALFSPTDILMSNGTEAAADDADMQDL